MVLSSGYTGQIYVIEDAIARQHGGEGEQELKHAASTGELSENELAHNGIGCINLKSGY